MHLQRQRRLRVLEALEERIKQFRRREQLWPLRIPDAPIVLEDVIDRALAGETSRFDIGSLRSRTLLSLEWEDGSQWEAWMTVLPSGFKVYCDTGEEESRILASGGRNEGDDSDRAFLDLLSESAGEHFGIGMSGGAPARVRSSIADREFLTDVFVNLFEVTGAEASVRSQLAVRDAAPIGGSDFRADVSQWLEQALRAKSAHA